VRFEVITALSIMSRTCSLVEKYRRFGETCCFGNVGNCLPDYSALHPEGSNMHSFKTSKLHLFNPFRPQ